MSPEEVARTGDGEGSWTVKRLVGMLSVSALGYNFLANPEGFVLAVIYRALLGFVDDMAGELGYRANVLLDQLGDIFVGTLGAALGAPGRQLARLVLDLLGLVDGVVVDLASAGGPFGFVVVFATWGAVFLAVIYGASGAWRGYKWIRTVVA